MLSCGPGAVRANHRTAAAVSSCRHDATKLDAKAGLGFVIDFHIVV